MLLMVYKCIRRRICHSICWSGKSNKKYMRNHDKSKKSSYLQNWDVNNLYWWAMPQRLTVYNFEWINDFS